MKSNLQVVISAALLLPLLPSTVHAVAYIATLLDPAGFGASYGQGAAPGSQVGYGYPAGTNQNRGLFWKGSAASAVDLTPPGMMTSIAWTATENYQAGSSDG